MTTAQVVKVFHAKSKVRGKKWMALCPVHGDRHASLEIAVGRKGNTLLLCRSHGCDVRDILSAVGLTFSDLFADSKPDAKAMREAERLAAKEALERKKSKDDLRRTIGRRNEEVGRRNALGKLLMNDWRNTRLNRLFHESVDKARSLDQSVVDQMVRVYGFKPDYFVVGDL